MSRNESEYRIDEAVLALQSGRITRGAFTKRLLGAGLSLSAAGSLLAACGGDDDEPADEAAEHECRFESPRAGADDGWMGHGPVPLAALSESSRSR